MTAARRRFGWLAAVSLLLHGWLPVALTAALTTKAGDVPICSAQTMAPAASPRPAQGPECPLTHDPICLCALFAKVLGPELGPAPAPPSAPRGTRRRRPTRRPIRSRPAPVFEARAPPACD